MSCVFLLRECARAGNSIKSADSKISDEDTQTRFEERSERERERDFYSNTRALFACLQTFNEREIQHTRKRIICYNLDYIKSMNLWVLCCIGFYCPLPGGGGGGGGRRNAANRLPPGAYPPPPPGGGCW